MNKYIYVIYDTQALRLQPLIRGFFSSYKRANEALEKLNDSVKILNDIFNKQVRFVIKIYKINELL